MTKRIARIVSENITPAENCLAITFTRRAAEEMRSRLKCNINIHTFHSLCFSILKENYEIAGLKPDFQVSADLKVLNHISAELEDDTKGGNIIEENTLSFDDLIILTVKLLNENPDIAKNYQNRFKYVSVDEYQDIDEKQYELIRLLAPSNAYICDIGDPNQAIYGFRGGDSKFFKSFRVDYPEAQIISLKNNYRSTGTIVNASNQMIDSYNIVSAFEKPHEKITIHAAPTEKLRRNL